MGLLFKNNAETTLSSGINNSTTTVPVASAAVFPTPDANNVFFATIEEGNNIEVVKVTGISSNNLTVVRAQDNTSAAAFGSGSKIELRLTAKILEMGTSSLTDLDGDTKIEVEKTADSDTIALTSNSGDFSFTNSSNTIALVKTDNNDFIIQNNLNDKDFVLKGYDADGDGLITALTIDYSNSGDAVFRRQITLREALYINTADNSATTAYIYDDSGDFVLRSFTQDKDIVFKGNDGGSIIDALKLDMSEGGKAIFPGNSIEFDNSTNNTQYATIAINDPGNNAPKYLELKGHSGVNLIGNQVNFYDNASTPQFSMSISPGVSSTNPTFTASGANTTSFFFRTNSGGSTTTGLSISSSGIAAAGNVTAYSDERLKDNIETIENGLDKVEQLRGVTYTRDEKENIGVIAQEVEKILPEVVLTADDEMGTKSVDYGKLTSVLIEAVKELSARVKELEDK